MKLGVSDGLHVSENDWPTGVDMRWVKDGQLTWSYYEWYRTLCRNSLGHEVTLLSIDRALYIAGRQFITQRDRSWTNHVREFRQFFEVGPD